MNSVRATVVLAVFSFIGPAGFSQSTSSFATGLGIELGFDYNNMFWRAPYSSKCAVAAVGDRLFFRLTPTFRIKYDAHIVRGFVLMRWSVSVESWFGPDNLADPNTLTHTTVRQNNYRVLLGYAI